MLPPNAPQYISLAGTEFLSAVKVAEVSNQVIRRVVSLVYHRCNRFSDLWEVYGRDYFFDL